MDEKLLNEEQVADRLNTSKRTLQGWRQRGDGPHYVKVGNLIRYQPSKVDDYLSRNTREATRGVQR